MESKDVSRRSRSTLMGAWNFLVLISPSSRAAAAVWRGSAKGLSRRLLSRGKKTRESHPASCWLALRRVITSPAPPEGEKLRCEITGMALGYRVQATQTCFCDCGEQFRALNEKGVLRGCSLPLWFS